MLDVMQLDKHLESVRNGVQQAAALADEHSQDVARRLSDALESSVRLALIDALSDASDEISADLAPGSVEFRLRNGEPQFVVTPPAAPAAADPEPDITFTEDDSEQVRVTLRIPATLKEQVDEAADAEGVSTNTWLVQQVRRSIARKRTRRADGFENYIESTVENAMESAFSALDSLGNFDTGRNRRGNTKSYKGWAQ